MRYRPATIHDATAISALIVSFLPTFTVDPTGRGAEAYVSSVSADAVRSYLESARYVYLVAEAADGSLAGVIAIRDRTHVFHLFVAAAMQRQGLARTLWDRVQQMLPEDADAVEFTVNATPVAVPFYARLGFVPTQAPVQKHGIAYVPMRRSRPGAVSQPDTV